MTSTEEDSKCVVETKDGPIRGCIDHSEEGSIYKFKSIPYANPPVGRLRFLPPTPFKPWTDIKDCTQEAPGPTQYRIGLDKTINLKGSEDCLYIEVNTPNLHPNKPLPVMFWIGLCFEFAVTMDDIFDSALLTAENIVFVRCDFRLGPFGFLSVNDFTAPGNCGLKDIVMALKWVQRNISYFGGDPTNVTIFGSSGGGAIVHLMMLSPMVTGLFHKAIIQSASALNNWSLTKNPTQPVLELGKIAGISKTQLTELVEELRSLTLEEIMEAFRKYMDKAGVAETSDIFDAIFKPCIEVEFEGQPAFLTRSPASLLKAENFNKVPLIIGSNNIEGAIIQYCKKDFYVSFEKYNQNKELLVPRMLAGVPNLCKTIGDQLLKFYLGGDEELRKDTKAQYIQLITDYYFLYYVNKTLRLHKQYAPECPIYYYVLNHEGEWAVPEPLDFLNTSGHVAEIPFLFRIKLRDQPVCKGSRDSVRTRSRMVKMWTNFAKYGDPTPEHDNPLLPIKWDPVADSDKLNYLSIGGELTKGVNPFQERMAFWDDLHKEHTFLRTLVYFNDLGVTW